MRVREPLQVPSRPVRRAAQLQRLRAPARRATGALATPATHAILAQLKAGETVYQAGELPKTLGVSKRDYEPPKTVCKTTFASIFPPSMENGDGTRHWRQARPSCV